VCFFLFFFSGLSDDEEETRNFAVQKNQQAPITAPVPIAVEAPKSAGTKRKNEDLTRVEVKQKQKQKNTHFLLNNENAYEPDTTCTQNKSSSST